MGGSKRGTALALPRLLMRGPHRQLVRDVEKYGFHIMMVRKSLHEEHGHELSAADQERERRWRHIPDWSYTIGLYHTYGHPEIVVFTLDENIVKPLFWDLARAMQAGRAFVPGGVYEGALPSFEGQQCAFERVSPEWNQPLFGFANWFYRERAFPVLQYLWPDRFGHFAWEKDVGEHILSAQPVLSEPPVDKDAPPLLRTAH